MHRRVQKKKRNSKLINTIQRIIGPNGGCLGYAVTLPEHGMVMEIPVLCTLASVLNAWTQATGRPKPQLPRWSDLPVMTYSTRCPQCTRFNGYGFDQIRTFKEGDGTVSVCPDCGTVARHHAT
jgi:hypothetical protein